MKMKRNLFTFLFFVLFTMNGFSQGINPAQGDYHVRVAFIGNSITIGANLTNQTEQSYPARASQMLKQVYGDTCVVSNYAVSGRTMMKNGDYPIWNETQFTQMWNFAPDIVYIMMGTNDSKPQNWGVYGPEAFFADYKAMIDTMKVRNPRTKFMVAFPPPCYKTGDLSGVWLINDSIIKNGVIPIVDSLAKMYEIPVVDFYTAFRDSGALFPDYVHPNAQGSLSMGKMVFEKFMETDLVHQVEKGYPFVTGITTATRVAAVGDSATLSWTTINADSVFFDGKKVAVNGTITVSTAPKSTYTVYAYGAKGVDSLKFTQPTYVPELTKLYLNVKSVKMNQNDSTRFELYFYDQQNKQLKGKKYNTNWTISLGAGKLVDVTDSSVVFVGTVAGKAELTATVGALSIMARITVNEVVGVSNSSLSVNKIYPNPVRETLTLEIGTSNTDPVTVQVFDTKGALVLKKQISVTGTGRQVVEVNTNDLNPGLYLLSVEGTDLKYSEKFRKDQ